MTAILNFGKMVTHQVYLQLSFVFAISLTLGMYIKSKFTQTSVWFALLFFPVTIEQEKLVNDADMEQLLIQFRILDEYNHLE